MDQCELVVAGPRGRTFPGLRGRPVLFVRDEDVRDDGDLARGETERLHHELRARARIGDVSGTQIQDLPHEKVAVDDPRAVVASPMVPEPAPRAELLLHETRDE